MVWEILVWLPLPHVPFFVACSLFLEPGCKVPQTGKQPPRVSEPDRMEKGLTLFQRKAEPLEIREMFVMDKNSRIHQHCAFHQ